MGAATDLENEGLRRLVVNAVYWALGMEVPSKADVTYVDDYHPLFYGFKGHRVGIRPEDHALGKVLRTAPAAKPAGAARAAGGAMPAEVPLTAGGPLKLNQDDH